MTKTMKPADLKKLCLTLYGIYAASAVLQFFEETLLLGLLALVIAYILGTSKKEDAKGTPYASHLRWMSRTFWIGTAVIVPAAIVIATALIWFLTDIVPVVTAVSNGDPDALMSAIQTYIAQNLRKVSSITMITMIPTVIWWLRRCYVGYDLADKGQPVEKVTSWL